MDEQEYATWQSALEQRGQELEMVIRNHKELLRAQTSPDPGGDSHPDFNHPADMVTGDPDYEKEVTIIDRGQAELTLVHQALTRLREGRFGICGHCNTEISRARLRAIPYARYCVQCQRKLAH